VRSNERVSSEKKLRPVKQQENDFIYQMQFSVCTGGPALPDCFSHYLAKLTDGVKEEEKYEETADLAIVLSNRKKNSERFVLN
jgi:hypothetical protein